MQKWLRKQKEERCAFVWSEWCDDYNHQAWIETQTHLSIVSQLERLTGTQMLYGPAKRNMHILLQTVLGTDANVYHNVPSVAYET